MPRRVRRFIVNPSLNERQQTALLRVYSWTKIDAICCAFKGHRPFEAREKALTCRLLIDAFGQPNPFGAFNSETGKFERRPTAGSTRSEVRHAS